MISPFSSIAPVSAGSALVSALIWLQGTLLGTVAAGLCVIAVAVVGLMMFEGRLPVKHGARVMIGCFVLLGAPVIASGLMGAVQGGGAAPPPKAPPATELPAREELPPADYDPYAGASLRRI